MIVDPFRSLTIRLPGEVIKSLKSYCANEGTTIQKFMCKVIISEMEKLKRKKK